MEVRKLPEPLHKVSLRPEHGELFLERVYRVLVQFPRRRLSGKILSRPFMVEPLIVLDQRLARGVPQRVDAPEVHLEEGDDLFGMLRGERLIRHQQDRLARAALAGHGYRLEAPFLRLMRERRPERDQVALALREGVQPGLGVYVAERDVPDGQPESVQPLRHGIERGRSDGAQNGLALHRIGRPRHIRKRGIETRLGEHRTVCSGVDARGEGFVVPHADDLDAAFQHRRQRGQRAARADAPFALVDARDQFSAGAVPLHFKGKPRLLVPSHFLAVPRGEGFVLGKPRRLQRHGLLRRARSEQTEDTDGKDRQTTVHYRFEHFPTS